MKLNAPMIITPKRQKMLEAHGKLLRNDGITYRVVAQTAGSLVFVSALQIAPSTGVHSIEVDLLGRTKEAKALSSLIEMGLIS